MSHATNAELAHCDRCGADTTRTTAGRCTVCLARKAGREERERRRKAEEHDRKRLGLQPVARARTLVLHCLDAGLYWCRLGLRAGEDEQLERIRFHLARARGELER